MKKEYSRTGESGSVLFFYLAVAGPTEPRRSITAFAGHCGTAARQAYRFFGGGACAIVFSNRKTLYVILWTSQEFSVRRKVRWAGK